jgi:hypothetical protein
MGSACHATGRSGWGRAVLQGDRNKLLDFRLQ